eukprot:10192858-Lingulodinium_polyedra.AAC.1
MSDHFGLYGRSRLAVSMSGRRWATISSIKCLAQQVRLSSFRTQGSEVNSVGNKAALKFTVDRYPTL